MHSMSVVTLGWGNMGILIVEVISHIPGSMGMPSAKAELETRLNNRARHMYFPFILLSFLSVGMHLRTKAFHKYLYRSQAAYRTKADS
jgi:hypothetical protein